MQHTWIELHTAVPRRNIQLLRKAVQPGAELIAVVKANAYGHGMRHVAREAWACGVRRFAVAHIDEALELRRLLPKAEIIIVSVTEPVGAPLLVRNNIIPVIVDAEHARALARHVPAGGPPLRCHAKIDTGMGRLGFLWDGAAQALIGLARVKRLALEGACTHLASASPVDRRYADEQVRRFNVVVEQCRAAGLDLSFRHVSNSGGIQCDPAWDLQGVRSGILLYGYGHDEAPGSRRVSTRPFLQWRTHVLQVRKVPAGFTVSYDSTYATMRPTHLATVDVGYSDGYSRGLSNKGVVVIRGRRYPVVGRVTMNLIIVDLGPRTPVKPWDVVTLLGSDGRASVWADELAALRGAISYEVLTSIRTDVTRVL